MKIIVDNYTMYPSRFIAGTKGSYGFDLIELSFGDGWEGLNKKLVFCPPTGTPVSVLWTGEPVAVPVEVTSVKGKSRFAVVGYDGEKTRITVCGELDVLNTVDTEGANAAQKPTPSEMSQALEYLRQAQETAQSVRDDADRGAFNGNGWHIGTAVSGTAEVISAEVDGAAAGELYLNTDSFGVYYSTAVGKWSYIGCLKGENTVERAVKKYSVRFENGAVTGVREDDAVGMTAGVAVDGETVRNDFDDVSFFNRRICNARWDDSSNTWRIIAYKGDENFVWSGNNVFVLYECTPFYISDNTDFGTYVSVCSSPCDGYSLAPMFKAPNQKVYLPCFDTSIINDEDSGYIYVRSQADDSPEPCSYSDSAYTLGQFAPNMYFETAEIYYSETALQLVEFATKDLHSVMAGASNMLYRDTNAVILEMQGTNTFTLASKYADRLVVGQRIAIADVGSLDDVTSYAVKEACITAIGDAADGVATVTVDRNISAAAVGNVVTSLPYPTGKAARAVLNASSGSLTDNTSGKYPCIWRGKENPWGNARRMLYNIRPRLISESDGSKRLGLDYVYHLDAVKDDIHDLHCVLTNISLPSVSGGIRRFGRDRIYDCVAMPVETDSAADTSPYYSFKSTTGNLIVTVGGGLADGAKCGLYVDVTDTASAKRHDLVCRMLVI